MSPSIAKCFIKVVCLVSEGRKATMVLLRTRWDIMASVLKAARSGRAKTYIMRKCNLSHRQLRAYLDLLVDKDLLEMKLYEGNRNSTKIFVTTEKGQRFLKSYIDLKATLKERGGRALLG